MCISSTWPWYAHDSGNSQHRPHSDRLCITPQTTSVYVVCDCRIYIQTPLWGDEMHMVDSFNERTSIWLARALLPRNRALKRQEQSLSHLSTCRNLRWLHDCMRLDNHTNVHGYKTKLSLVQACGQATCCSQFGPDWSAWSRPPSPFPWVDGDASALQTLHPLPICGWDAVVRSVCVCVYTPEYMRTHLHMYITSISDSGLMLILRHHTYMINHHIPCIYVCVCVYYVRVYACIHIYTYAHCSLVFHYICMQYLRSIKKPRGAYNAHCSLGVSSCRAIWGMRPHTLYAHTWYLPPYWFLGKLGHAGSLAQGRMARVWARTATAVDEYVTWV